MKVFMEADFKKGSGALRWEGVSARVLRGILYSVGASLAVIGYMLMNRVTG